MSVAWCPDGPPALAGPLQPGAEQHVPPDQADDAEQRGQQLGQHVRDGDGDHEEDREDDDRRVPEAGQGQLALQPPAGQRLHRLRKLPESDFPRRIVFVLRMDHHRHLNARIERHNGVRIAGPQRSGETGEDRLVVEAVHLVRKVTAVNPPA